MVVARRPLPTSKDRYWVKLSSRRAIGEKWFMVPKTIAVNQTTAKRQSGNIANQLSIHPPTHLQSSPGLPATPIFGTKPQRGTWLTPKMAIPRRRSEEIQLKRSLPKHRAIADTR